MNLMKRFLVSMAIPAIALLVAATTPARVAVAQSEPGGAETPACVVLDTYGFWRMHHTLQPPVLLDNAGTLSPALLDVQWTDIETPAAPDGWAAPEFDDGSWLRGPARMACRTPYLSRLCLRGVFGVTDPSKAVGLNLTLVYQGGAIVYLNGKEIARQDIAPARPGHPVLAAAYPVEAFVAKDGKLLRGWQTSEEKADTETRRRVALRVRTLRHVALPRDLLRKGPNVLAVEIVRAPYPPAIRTGKKDRPAWNDVHTNGMIYEPDFNTCQLVGLQLAAPGATAWSPTPCAPRACARGTATSWPRTSTWTSAARAASRCGPCASRPSGTVRSAASSWWVRPSRSASSRSPPATWPRAARRCRPQP